MLNKMELFMVGWWVFVVLLFFSLCGSKILPQIEKQLGCYFSLFVGQKFYLYERNGWGKGGGGGVEFLCGSMLIRW